MLVYLVFIEIVCRGSHTACSFDRLALTSAHISKPTSRRASQQAAQPTGRPADQLADQPAQPANRKAGQPTGLFSMTASAAPGAEKQRAPPTDFRFLRGLATVASTLLILPVCAVPLLFFSFREPDAGWIAGLFAGWLAS